MNTKRIAERSGLEFLKRVQTEKLGNGNSERNQKVNQIWGNYLSYIATDGSSDGSDKSKGNLSREEVEAVKDAVAQFTGSSIPHVIIALSESKTRKDILEGKLTKEQVDQRALGQDFHSKLTRAMLQTSMKMGCSPNVNGGDLVKLVIFGDEGMSAVNFAVSRNSFNSLKTLVENGGDVNLKDVYGEATVHHITEKSIFDKKYMSPDEPNLNLLKRYDEINKQLIQKLVVDKTTDINVKDEFKNNALHNAANVLTSEGVPSYRHGVRIMVDRGIDVNAQNLDGNTPLHIAANIDNLSFVGALSNSGKKIEVNAQNKKGWTPLHLAALADNVDVYKKLLSMGANPEIEDLKGNKPLHYFENDKRELRYKVAWGEQKEAERQAKKKEFLDSVKTRQLTKVNNGFNPQKLMNRKASSVSLHM